MPKPSLSFLSPSSILEFLLRFNLPKVALSNSIELPDKFVIDALSAPSFVIDALSAVIFCIVALSACRFFISALSTFIPSTFGTGLFPSLSLRIIGPETIDETVLKSTPATIPELSGAMPEAIAESSNEFCAAATFASESKFDSNDVVTTEPAPSAVALSAPVPGEIDNVSVSETGCFTLNPIIKFCKSVLCTLRLRKPLLLLRTILLSIFSIPIYRTVDVEIAGVIRAKDCRN